MNLFLVVLFCAAVCFGVWAVPYLTCLLIGAIVGVAVKVTLGKWLAALALLVVCGFAVRIGE